MTTKQQQFLDFASRFVFTHTIPKLHKEEKKFMGFVYSTETITTIEREEYNDFSFEPTQGGNFKWKIETEPTQYVKNRLEILVMEFNLKSQFLAKVVNDYVIIE